jgi:hypothetical protein
MLDNDFLRSLGIKDDLLPTPDTKGEASGEKDDISFLPVAGESLVPPESRNPETEELKKFIKNLFTQENPYKRITRQGHVVAVYPHSCEGRYDIEMTVDEMFFL